MAELEQRRQSVLKRRRVIRAKLAQQAREKHKVGVVDELPAHSVQITPGWRCYPILTAEKYDVYKFEGTAETAIPRHKHPDHLELIYVVKGSVNLRINRRDEMMERGDIQRIAPGVEHEIICASRDTTLLSLFRPPISLGDSDDTEEDVDYAAIFADLSE